MKKYLIVLLALFSFSALTAPKNTKVKLSTNKGIIEIELFDSKAPLSVKNFLSYVDSGFYNGTIFHRVIDKFMIQGGGFDISLKQKETKTPIKNEATNRISNLTGTIAMARTGVVDSATSQFFINVSDNTFLDHQNQTARGFGYAVFGRVVKGMSVVNMIKGQSTKANGPFQNLPMENIIIEKVERIK